MSRYIDTAEVAKLIRRDLKKELPGVKFTVRMSRYSMGSSIRVAFKHGGDETSRNKAVAKDIADRYEGRGFDGMTDSSFYVPIFVDGEKCSSSCFVFLNSAEGYGI